MLQMTCKVLVLCAVMYTALASATDIQEFFTSQVEVLTVSAALTSTPGSTIIFCTAKCVAAGTSACAATAFLSETRICLFSAVRNANFSAAAPAGTRIFRRRNETGQSDTGTAAGTTTVTTTGTTTVTTTGTTTTTTVGATSPDYYVMLSRTNISVDFERNWTEYENGFGDGIDFWLGLKKIHEITGNSPKLLRVESVYLSNNKIYIFEYSGFTVGNASTNYTMTFNSYVQSSSNISTDNFNIHKGMQFSTKERDNDKQSGWSCSQDNNNGGWWFNACLSSYPTAGSFYTYNGVKYPNIYWSWDYLERMKAIRMLLI